MLVIAGATGKTGGVVAQTLLAQGKKVRVLVRDSAKAGDWASRGAEIAVAALDDVAALERALAGATGLYALVPEEVAIADFHAHRRAIVGALTAAVKAATVPHVVLLSAAAAVLSEGNGPAGDLRPRGRRAQRVLRLGPGHPARRSDARRRHPPRRAAPRAASMKLPDESKRRRR